MKKIGLIGGLSWQSTVEYYRIINETVAGMTEGKHAARIILDSLDFGEVETFISHKDFEGLTRLVTSSARNLEKTGAELLLICANTMHFIAPQVQESISIPLIHIVDVTIREIKTKGLGKVGLLGTKFTMEQDFYKQKFINQDIEILIPCEEDRDFIQSVIFTELFRAYINPESKKKYIGIIGSLIEQGAQGIILGCTEIPLLIHQEDCNVPVFDTTEIHARAAVGFAMKN